MMGTQLPGPFNRTRSANTFRPDVTDKGAIAMCHRQKASEYRVVNGDVR